MRLQVLHCSQSVGSSCCVCIFGFGLSQEALRGEGARLLNHKGRAFAKSYHPAGELAPRDIVSRMIVSEMAATGSPNVFLDISHRDAK